MAVLRSLRALALFWTVFISYTLQFGLVRVFGDRARRRWASVHSRNARRLARGFSRLGGVYIKAGQVLSVVGTFLPRPFADELTALRDAVPPRPFGAMRPRLVALLGADALSRFAWFDERAIAAASLAQVHRARARDGRELAVKLLYPDIQRTIRQDLWVMRRVQSLFRLYFDIQRAERIVDQLEQMLAHETDFDNERSNLARMRAIFAGRSDIHVPDVVDELSGPGVLTMSYEDGVRIADLDGLASAGIDRQAVADLVVEAFFHMLLEHRVFHADPHPGNFVVRPGPTLVILDHGAVEAVSDSLYDGMRMAALGFLLKNDEMVLGGLDRMGFAAPDGDRKLLADVGREYLRVLSSLTITDFAQLDRTTLVQLVGVEQLRGRLRSVMRSIQYPDGYFYVERTAVLLFGLVGHLAPERGLPGIAQRLMTEALSRGALGGPRAA